MSCKCKNTVCKHVAEAWDDATQGDLASLKAAVKRKAKRVESAKKKCLHSNVEVSASWGVFNVISLYYCPDCKAAASEVGRYLNDG